VAYAWQCPFCGHHSTIGTDNTTGDSGSFDDGNKYGRRHVSWVAVSCPNPRCREYTFRVWIRNIDPTSTSIRAGKETQHFWQLVPAAEMKVLPDYVPAPIVADYKEACLIANLSPKASATLARRCLQGMIRNFWEVKPGRLVDEIKAIENRVDADAWRAIEAVRSVGNIGAHMEADINVIVDVEPEEAKLLIGLIETLVEEWYVAQHERKSRFARLAEIAAEKLAARKEKRAEDEGA
jgi:hypothetical protein